MLAQLSAESDEQNQQLVAQMQKYTQVCEQLQAEQKQLSECQAKQKASANDLETATSSLKAKEKDLKAKEKELKVLEKAVAKAEAAVDKLSKESKALKSELSDAKKNWVSCKKELESTKGQNSAALAKLQADIETRNDELSQLRAEGSSVSERLTSAEKALSVIRKEKLSLEGSLASAQKELSSLKDAKDQAEGSLASAQTEIQSLKDAHCQAESAKDTGDTVQCEDVRTHLLPGRSTEFEARVSKTELSHAHIDLSAKDKEIERLQQLLSAKEAEVHVLKLDSTRGEQAVDNGCKPHEGDQTATQSIIYTRNLLAQMPTEELIASIAAKERQATQKPADGSQDSSRPDEEQIDELKKVVHALRKQVGNLQGKLHKAESDDRTKTADLDKLTDELEACEIALSKEQAAHSETRQTALVHHCCLPCSPMSPSSPFRFPQIQQVLG